MQVFKVVSNGVNLYFGPKRNEATEAFNESRESVEFWKLENGVSTLLSKRVVPYVKLQDIARYKV